MSMIDKERIDLIENQEWLRKNGVTFLGLETHLFEKPSYDALIKTKERGYVRLISDLSMADVKLKAIEYIEGGSNEPTH